MASNWPKLPCYNSKQEIPFIPNDWKSFKVEDIFQQLNSGTRYSKKMTLATGKIPVIDQSADGNIGWHNESCGVNASVQRPVVTFANHTCEMRWLTSPFSVIQNVFSLIGKPEVCDTRYLYYSTKGVIQLEEYKGHFPDYRRAWIVLPPLPEQKAIAHVLGTLDDQIENLRQQNEVLEEMAKGLFKSWFVDFEPVRAKIDGRWKRGQSLPGLPAHLFDLFPDRLVEVEESDELLPDGWVISTIGKEVEIVGGGTPSTTNLSFWKNGENLWVTPKDLSGIRFPVLFNTERKITDAGLKKISSGLLPEGTVLLSSRAPIGYLAINQKPVAINQGFIAMKCNGKLRNLYILQWCIEKMDTIKGNSNGSTFQEISKTNFRPIQINVPSQGVLGEYYKHAEKIYNQLVANAEISLNLTSLRDTLLPKLVSGEVRIANINEVLENAKRLEEENETLEDKYVKLKIINEKETE